MFMLQAPRQVLEQLACAFGIAARVSLAHRVAYGAAHPLGRRVAHVALLMRATALDQCTRAERVGDRLAQGLGPVEHKQQAALGRQPALDQIGQQGLARRRILGRTFAQPQRVFLTACINPNRGQHHMVSEVYPSIITAMSFSPANLRSISAPSLRAVPTMNRSLTTLLLTPCTRSSSGTGSSERA